LLGCIAILLGSGCAAVQRFAARPAPDSIAFPTPAPVYDQVFATFWDALNENYVYADAGVEGLQAAYAELLPQVEAAGNDEEFAGLVETLVRELPAGSVIYETRAERIASETRDSSRYEGIGAIVAVRSRPEPHVVVLTTIRESPAERAGLQAHDSILAIDGDPVREEEGLDVVQRIRGPAGSEAVLTVRSPDGQVRDLRVAREQMSTAYQLQAAFIPEAGLAYFLFPPAAYDALGSDFASSYQAASAQGLNGIILDLRIASEGVGWPLEGLLGLFADGQVGEFYSRQDSTPVTVQGQDILRSQSLPLAILVGPDTSGAPEIFAAILQATGRAQVFGLPTEGNVEAFSEFQLPDGSRALIITRSFRTPAGEEIGLTGVAPDSPVEADWDVVTQDDDPVVEAAVAWLSEQR
jgi:carboxyl-terminal processing protease